MKGDAPQEKPVYDGVVAVGLMALHDRDFFEKLLDNPRAAIEAKKDLEVTPQEIARVEELIARRGTKKSPKDTLELWDRWKKTGFWDAGDWPFEWMRRAFP